MHPVASQILSLELSQVGYVEIPVNRTRYAIELDANEKPPLGRQGIAWCGTFQDWAFWKCNATPALAYRNYGTVVAAKAYMRAKRWYTTPEPGDLAFLHNAGLEGHVAFVEAVNLGASTVTTVEGNTSSGNAGSQRNGGMVARRVRPLSFWVGYGRPNYEVLAPPVAPVDWAAISAMIASYRQQVLQLGSKGPAVAFLQRCLGITDDGDFGPATLASVKNHQTLFVQHQLVDLHIPAGSSFLLAVDGVVDAHTWAALLDTGGDAPR